MIKRLMIAGLAVLLGAAATLAMWKIRQLTEQQRRTTQELQQTASSLQAVQQAKAELQQVYEQLTQDYDTLKSRWTQSEQERKRLAEDLQQLNSDLATRVKERDDVSRQVTSLTQALDDAKAKVHRAQEELAGVKRAQLAFQEKEVSAREREGALRAQLDQVADHFLTLSEAKQLAAAFAKERAEKLQLRDRLVALSRVLEPHAQEPPYETRSGLAPSGGQPPAFAQRPSPRLPIGPGTKELAALYRELGVLYLATHQYPKAAEALEESLAIEDMKAVHAKLAFIYERLLANPDQATYHARMAHPLRPGGVVLGAKAEAYGLPRNDRRLVWQWLTGK